MSTLPSQGRRRAPHGADAELHVPRRDHRQGDRARGPPQHCLRPTGS